MAGWLHGVLVGEWLFGFPLCAFSLSHFCKYPYIGLSQFFTRGHLMEPAALWRRLPHVHVHAISR